MYCRGYCFTPIMLLAPMISGIRAPVDSPRKNDWKAVSSRPHLSHASILFEFTALLGCAFHREVQLKQPQGKVRPFFDLAETSTFRLLGVM